MKLQEQQRDAANLQLQQARDDLQDASFSGTSGGGLVEATVTGGGVLTGLVIKPEAIDPDDAEGLADLVVAAVRDATSKAAQEAEKVMPDLGSLGL